MLFCRAGWQKPSFTLIHKTYERCTAHSQLGRRRFTRDPFHPPKPDPTLRRVQFYISLYPFPVYYCGWGCCFHFGKTHLISWRFRGAIHPPGTLKHPWGFAFDVVEVTCWKKCNEHPFSKKKTRWVPDLVCLFHKKSKNKIKIAKCGLQIGNLQMDAYMDQKSSPNNEWKKYGLTTRPPPSQFSLLGVKVIKPSKGG